MGRVCLESRLYRRLLGNVGQHGEFGQERSGVLLRVECEATGRVGFGDCACLPAFGTETVEEALDFWKAFEVGQPVGKDLPCCAFALESALLEMETEGFDMPYEVESACLLPLENPLEKARVYMEAGSKTLKLKVRERSLKEARSVVEEAGDGVQIRLDGNASLTRASLETFCKELGDGVQSVEFFEQPLKIGQETIADEILTHYGLSLGLDESVVHCPDDLRAMAERLPHSIFVLKVSLIHPQVYATFRREHPQMSVVYSTALESEVGFSHLLRVALSDKGNVRLGGFDGGDGMLERFENGLWHFSYIAEAHQALWDCL